MQIDPKMKMAIKRFGKYCLYGGLPGILAVVAAEPQHYIHLPPWLPPVAMPFIAGFIGAVVKWFQERSKEELRKLEEE